MSTKKKKKAPQGQKKKPQGHYCKVCGERKANESFSGKGHAAHICKECAKLSPAERSARVIINKIDNMAYRTLSKEDIKWLRSKLNDPNPEIQRAARGVHSERFREYERSQSQKGLTVLSLVYFIHDTVWDEYGDEHLAHVRFIMANSGNIKRIDCSTGEEKEVQVDQKEAQKFLKSLIHEWHVLFWDEDFGESEDEDEDYDVDEDDDFMTDDEEFGVGDREEDKHPIATAVSAPNREPVLSMHMELNKGKEKELTFYEYTPQEAELLFWELQAWFEDDALAFDDEDDEDFEQ